MSDITTIPGVNKRELQRPGTTVSSTLLALDDDFNESSALAVVDAIDDGLSLVFFDAEHPQRSDPGLYVYFQRRDGELFVKGANHGWSYPWLLIDSTTAARWLWLCRGYNNGDGRYESSVMRLSRGTQFTPDLDPAAGLSFTNWLARRLVI